MESVLTFILAGGRGSRLFPLTKSRAKPILPFLGSQRLIDFALLNCKRSGISKAWTLTSNASLLLELGTDEAWTDSETKLVSRMDGKLWEQSLREAGYEGTADAIRQNLTKIPDSAQDVLILSADHVYSMDYRKLIEFHRAQDALLTVAGFTTGWREASRFGVFETDPDHRVVGFQEKPRIPPDLLLHQKALVSMGIYAFNAQYLREVLTEYAGNDFGHDILPTALETGRVFAFNTSQHDNRCPKWRDVGTIEAYWQTQMDILSENREGDPQLALWAGLERRGWDSLPWLPTPGNFESPRNLSPVVAGRVTRSVLCRGALVHEGAEVTDSILLEGVVVGPGARVRRAIVDRGAIIPARTEIGFDLERDRKNYWVSEGGIVVVTAPRVALQRFEDYGAAHRRSGRQHHPELYIG